MMKKFVTPAQVVRSLQHYNYIWILPALISEKRFYLQKSLQTLPAAFEPSSNALRQSAQAPVVSLVLNLVSPRLYRAVVSFGFLFNARL